MAFSTAITTALVIAVIVLALGLSGLFLEVRSLRDQMGQATGPRRLSPADMVAEELTSGQLGIFERGTANVTLFLTAGCLACIDVVSGLMSYRDSMMIPDGVTYTAVVMTSNPAALDNYGDELRRRHVRLRLIDDDDFRSLVGSLTPVVCVTDGRLGVVHHGGIGSGASLQRLLRQHLPRLMATANEQEE